MDKKDEFKQRTLDKISGIGDLLKNLARKKKEARYEILVGVKDIVIEYDKILIDKHFMQFSFEKRWYDKDPFSWMVMNSIQYADEKLLSLIKSYLKKEIEPENPGK